MKTRKGKISIISKLNYIRLFYRGTLLVAFLIYYILTRVYDIPFLDYTNPLTYIVLGLIANYGPIDNDLQQASENLAKLFKLGFFEWGIILFCIGMGIGILVLLIIASTVDKTNEKAARRAARLAKIEADMDATAKAE